MASLCRVLAITLAVGLSGFSAAAQTLSVADRPDGATLRFAAGAGDALAARIEDRTVAIRFSRQLTPPDLEATASSALISDARINEDGLVLTLANPASIDARRAGGTITLDLYRDLSTGVGQIVIGPSAASAEMATPRVQTAAATAPAGRAPMAIPAAVGQGEHVRVRVGEHPDRTRLVFDWPQPVAFERVGAGNPTTIRFARSARLNLAALRKHHPRRIAALEFGQTEGATLVTLGVRPGGRIEVFRLDRRVVVDAYGPVVSGAPAVSVAATTPGMAQPQRMPAAAMPTTRTEALVGSPATPPVRPQIAEDAPAAATETASAPAPRPRTRTGPALAGFYVAGRLGGGSGGLFDVEPRAGGVIEDPSSGFLTTSGEVGFDFNRLGAPIRIGVELNNQSFGSYDVQEVGPLGTTDAQLEVNSLALMGVASVDFKGPLGFLGESPVTPFVTGGIGLAINTVALTDSTAVGTVNESEQDLAWMVGGGASYDYNDRLAIEGRYAYSDRGEVIDANGVVADLAGHEFTIGARWRF